jgi:RNA polymerase sigma factor (sigma-70 family)
MSDRHQRTLMRCLRRVARLPGCGALPDGLLLERFVRERDEAAFELLLWRHGPMVLNLCRRLLRHEQDAEDAFQATFLVFVRKAGSVSKREGVGGWLYRVAYRVALRAQAAAVRRARRERPAVDVMAPEPADGVEQRDLRPVLHEEINRLPEPYRAAVVLCYLEGKTNQEAARHLGCAEGTVASRLARARERLRVRLVRRGLALSVGTLTGVLMEHFVPAPVSAAFLDSTMTAATAFAAGKAAGAVSAPSAALAEGVLRTMGLSKLTMAAGVIGSGAGGLTYQTLAAGRADADRETPHRSARSGRVTVPGRVDGVLLVIGTEIKEGEKVPPGLVVTIKVGGEEKKYRRLREGDRVEEGQLLARLDDMLARDEVTSKKAAVDAAKAEWEASIRTRDEAWQRYQTVEQVWRGNVKNTVSWEDVRGARLTYDRFFFEEIGKKAAIKKAGAELNQAENALKMYEIRSPMRGVVHDILKYRGEAVRALEPVVRLRIADGEE